MKKIVIFVLVFSMIVSLCACGQDGGKNDETTANQTEVGTTVDTTESEPEPEPEVPTTPVGGTVSTDIVALTLDWAELAIVLENTWGDDYLMPKEYDAASDSNNPFVASKGHTLVAITFTAENLDRANVEFDGVFNGKLITVNYGDENYSVETEYGANGVTNKYGAIDWKEYKSINVLLSAGEKETYKCYVDIPVDVASLEDAFKLTFTLPNSSGEKEDHTFIVDKEGLATAKTARDAAAQAAKDAEAAEKAAALAEVDTETAAAVTNCVQGMWEYTSGKVKYQLTFSGNNITVVSTISGYSISNEGTFSVRRDYILIDYVTGGQAGIPYTYENGDFSMSAIVGFDD